MKPAPGAPGFPARRVDLAVELEHRKGSNAGGVEKLEEKIKALDDEIAAEDKKIVELESSLTALRQKYAANPEFAKYEAMRDDGVDLSRLKYKEQRALRKDLQIIFQDPYSSLNPRFTIGQIIEEGLVTHHFYKHGSEAMRQYIIETMEKCGLQDYMLHRYPISSPAVSGSASALPGRWRYSPSSLCATSASPRWTCPFSPRLSICCRS